MLTKGGYVELNVDVDSEALEYQSGPDDNDSWLDIEEGSDADGKKTHMAKEADEVDKDRQ